MTPVHIQNKQINAKVTIFIDNTYTYLPDNRTVPNTVITQITTIPGSLGPYI